MTATTDNEPTQSIGHVGFILGDPFAPYGSWKGIDYEYYKRNGKLYRAEMSLPVIGNGARRGHLVCRWSVAPYRPELKALFAHIVGMGTIR